jgi:aminoacylase
MRLPPSMDLNELNSQCQSWAVSNGVSYERLVGVLENPVTSIDPAESRWWKTFSETCQQLHLDVKPEIFPAATDSRFLRRIGVQCLGFTPLPRTPVLLHDHDERIDINIYIQGLDIYSALIKALAETE